MYYYNVVANHSLSSTADVIKCNRTGLYLILNQQKGQDMLKKMSVLLLSMKLTLLEERLKAFRFRSHDQNYVSAMVFRSKKFFRDNKKRLVSIGVFGCGESKYGILFLTGTFLRHVFGTFCTKYLINNVLSRHPWSKDLSKKINHGSAEKQFAVQESGKPNA